MPKDSIRDGSRGRPKAGDGRVLRNISFNAALLAEVDEFLRDPLTGKLQYGSRSNLINELLREFLEQRRRQ